MRKTFQYSSFASGIARLSGRPYAFFGAVAFVLGWATTGPLFDYSNTWQLVVND